MCQVGAGKTNAVEVSKQTRLTSEPGRQTSPGMSLAGARLLARWCPACRRREPGQAAFVWNGRERVLILSPGSGGERECPARLKPGGIEYRRGARSRTGS